jgi:uncharacterized protein YbjT (DUF2867 family)
MTLVLVPGATGNLGRHITEQLLERGYRVRILARDERRVQGRVAPECEVFIADATRPETLKGICHGVDAVISALGAPLSLGLSWRESSFRDVDYHGNANILNEAARAGVSKFVYVSVFGEKTYGHLEYVRAHEDFVQLLRKSAIPSTVVRPTGFFSTFSEVLKMARKGRLGLIGDGMSRTNPVHELDIAGVCVDVLEGTSPVVSIGGPIIYSRKQINELAFNALGKPPKMFRIPPTVAGGIVAMTRPLDRRLHHLLKFLTAVSQVDVIAPQIGTRRLDSFFNDLVSRG